MEKQEVQEVIDNFVMKNAANFERVSNENSKLYDALVGAINFLSLKYGTQGESESVVTILPDIKIEDESTPESELMPQVEILVEEPTISEISEVDRVETQEEELSEEDLKAAIKSLKPLAEFDDDIKIELKRLQDQLKAKKTKK